MVLKGVPRISRWRPSDVVLSRNSPLGYRPHYRLNRPFDLRRHPKPKLN
jgi:hypothetical protein